MANEVNNAGDALKRLEGLFDAVNIFSLDFKHNVVGWAMKMTELAHEDGRVKGKEHAINELRNSGNEAAAAYLEEKFFGR